MSCDIRICSDNAVFGQPEVQSGHHPGLTAAPSVWLVWSALGMAKQLVYSALNLKR